MPPLKSSAPDMITAAPTPIPNGASVESPPSGAPQQPLTAEAARPASAAPTPVRTSRTDTTTTLHGRAADVGRGVSNSSVARRILRRDVPSERREPLVPLGADVLEPLGCGVKRG